MFQTNGSAAKIGDISDVQGIRSNPLMGTGLVVGLNGTGDNSLPSAQMLTSLLRREADITFLAPMLQSANIAVVMVTTELGPWDREGSLIDVNISTLQDAASLQGGMLLATELKGLDGVVYAVARVAAISTTSWTVEGNTGSKVAKNHPTVARVPDGAHVERSELSQFFDVIGQHRYLTLTLRNGDFTTAERIRQAIDTKYPNASYAQDPGSVQVQIPEQVSAGNVLGFVDSIMQLEVEPHIPAVVVINERTGTIVVGGNVTITETAVAQGSLVVKIKEEQLVSQPIAPFTRSATTAVVPDSTVAVTEGQGHLITVPTTVTVEQLANALNAIGASPRDLIAIFDALSKAGALQAKLEMM
ncbi:MAG: flagellar basal body P-ring protein FlgI [Phycisphaerae bacterium]|nr:flagellar basal body P-ring protein FlgI [Phycisphaerae bacterium]